MKLQQLLFPTFVFLSVHCSAGDPSRGASPSSFDIKKIARDPFIPINVSNLGNQATFVFPADNKSEGELKGVFHVSGISRYNLGIALINGKAFAEKDTFIVKFKSQDLRVIVRKVSETGVELDCDGTLVSVPLRHEKVSLADDSTED